ncbi:MAG: DUF4145 domain-containing protein [Candidatus Sericytochromatia bacterium]
MSNYIAPEFQKESFTCPHCNAIAQQDWYSLLIDTFGQRRSELSIAYCAVKNCSQYTVWFDKDNENDPQAIATDRRSKPKRKTPIMIFPKSSIFPMPNPDTPEDIKADYMEARGIGIDSPRSSMALLRLCLQKLLKHLDCPHENINKDISYLVTEKGLPRQIQQSMDSIRILGNNAVHPSDPNLSFTYTPGEVDICFRLFNMIVQRMITEPKELDELYAIIPPTAREAIERRDKK